MWRRLLITQVRREIETILGWFVCLFACFIFLMWGCSNLDENCVGGGVGTKSCWHQLFPFTSSPFTASQWVLSGPAAPASVSPGNLLQVHIAGPRPGAAESESLTVSLGQVCFLKLFKWFRGTVRFETHDSWWQVSAHSLRNAWHECSSCSPF